MSAKASTPVVTIKIADLEVKHGVPAMKIRQMIRGLGFRAPEIALEPGKFGPKARYEWPAGSAEIVAIEEAIVKTFKTDKPAKASKAKAEAAPKAEKATKSSKKAAAPVVEVVEDEDDEDEDEE